MHMTYKYVTTRENMPVVLRGARWNAWEGLGEERKGQNDTF